MNYKCEQLWLSLNVSVGDLRLCINNIYVSTCDFFFFLQYTKLIWPLHVILESLDYSKPRDKVFGRVNEVYILFYLSPAFIHNKTIPYPYSNSPTSCCTFSEAPVSSGTWSSRCSWSDTYRTSCSEPTDVLRSATPPPPPPRPVLYV